MTLLISTDYHGIHEYGLALRMGQFEFELFYIIDNWYNGSVERVDIVFDNEAGLSGINF